jgi:hypothetical protein
MKILSEWKDEVMSAKNPFLFFFAMVLLFLCMLTSAHASSPKISWGAVTTDTNGKPITIGYYKLFRDSNVAGGNKIFVKDIQAPALTYTDANAPDSSLCYFVVAVSSTGTWGGYSAGACKDFTPPAKPGVTTSVTVAKREQLKRDEAMLAALFGHELLPH